MNVLLLGSTGMLGSKINKSFQESNKNLKLFTTNRKKNNKSIYFDVLRQSTYKNIKKAKPDYILNCIGVIKPHINEKSADSIINAFNVNSNFPKRLLEIFPKSKIIHFNTDCVFDGKLGNYDESSKHDCSDTYGISKSLGEIQSKRIMNIRCSIIGVELKSKLSLLSWFLNNKDKNIHGFVNHYWNGLTTDALAKIVIAILHYKKFKSGTFHLLPKNRVNKYQLLEIFNKKFFFGKKKIIPIKNNVKINRTLNTKYISFNRKLWELAGYKKIPTIKEMVDEIS